MDRFKRYRLRHPDRVRETRKRYREAHRSELNAKRREWGRKNKERCRNYMKAWTAKQPPKFWHRWPTHTPKPRKPGRTNEEVKANTRERHRKAAQLLTDVYLRGWMSRTTGFRIKPSEWPSALVEAKRALLKLKRLINYGSTEKHRRSKNATA